nr:TonB family protein [Acetobacter persici]
MKKTIPAALALLLVSSAAQTPLPALAAQAAEPNDSSENIPAAPEQAAKKNAEATVIMKAEIGKDGRNLNCRIIHSEKPELDDISLDYCRNTQYRPPIRNGVPVKEHDHLITVKYGTDN